MSTSDRPDETPLPGTVAFPPIPVSTDPQHPAPREDALEPEVPTYAAPEPMPDPAPSWLAPTDASAPPEAGPAPLIDVSRAADGPPPSSGV